jgi:acyl-CoA synthetase (AMP-forming)/AMP-acid ligase II
VANIAFLLDVAADTMGDRVAVGPRDGGLTYAELRDRAQRRGAEVAGRSADTLSFADANGVAVPLALFAAAWAGVPYAPINYRLPADQQRHLLDRLGATFHVGTDEGDAWAAGAAGAPGAGEPDGAAYPDEPGRPAVLLFTSGTTAEPKSAVLDHDNLLAYVLNTSVLASADEDEAVLLVVPPFHIAGVAGVLSAVFSGRRIVPLSRFSPEAWIDAVRRERVTHAFVVPTMLARIVAVLGEQGLAELPTLRTLSYGGARMPVPVLERALDLFPNAGFVNAYGLTETSATVTVLGPDDHRAAIGADDPAVRARLGSVGRPVPGVEVEVVDEAGVPVPAGTEGAIRIRGDQVSGRYVEQGSVVDGEGWLVTGDLGAYDAEGYLFVHGRSDDVIIVGGENISPSEVEDCLLRHPAVTGAAVVGLTDEEWGEQVGAMVTAVGQVEGGELTDWVREHLGGLKAPKRVALADELPMTPTGKVLRRVVRAELGKAP